MVEYAAGVVEGIADRDATGKQVLAGRLDVGNDQVQPLHRSGRSFAHILAEHDRAPGTWWRELNHAVVAAGRMVDVEPPTEIAVETLGAIGIGDGDDDDLE